MEKERERKSEWEKEREGIKELVVEPTIVYTILEIL